MRLSRLVLSNFRNLAAFEVKDIPPVGVVALVGENGVGKTSILEAISLLGGGRGLLGAEAKEQLKHGVKPAEGWAVFAETEEGSRAVGFRDGKRVAKIDGSEVGPDALGDETVVSLVPALDQMFFEAPGERRNVLDAWVAQIVPGHADTVSRYIHHTRARLRLLVGGGASDWLEAEEQQAAAWGIRLLQGRLAYLNRLSGHMEDLKLALAGGALAVWDADPDTGGPVAALKGKFERSREVDARMERTSAGPNTLDVKAELRRADTWVPANLASSGQHKRVLLLWLCGHVVLLKAHGVHPLVLVDDFGAHLDEAGRGDMMKALAGLGVQVWLSDVASPGGFVVAV